MSGIKPASGSTPADDWVASADVEPQEVSVAPEVNSPMVESVVEPAAEQQTDPKTTVTSEEPTQSPASFTDADLPKWAQSRIDTMTRKMREAEEAREALRQQLAKYEQPQISSVDSTSPALYTEEEVQRRAQQVAAEQTFNQQCSTIYETGKQAFQDWDRRMDTIRLAGGIPPAVIEAAIENGDAHVILAGLASQPEELTRLQALPPTKMGVAIAKFGQKLAKQQAAPKVSAAPLPPEGRARGTTVPEPDPDKMTMAEFMAYMDAQESNRAPRR